MAAMWTEARAFLPGVSLAFAGTLGLQFTVILLLYCTGRLVGAVQRVIPRTRKSGVQRKEESGTVSVLESGEGFLPGPSNVKPKPDMDMLPCPCEESEEICFGDGYPAVVRHSIRLGPLAIPKTGDVNLSLDKYFDREAEKAPLGYYAGLEIKSPLKLGLKERQTSQETIWSIEREISRKYFSTKLPVEQVDTSYHKTFTKCPWISSFCDVPSDGNGTQNNDQKCHANQKQSSSGKHPNLGVHERHKHNGTCGSSAGNDGDDGKDDEGKKRVEIPGWCQSSVTVDTEKEEIDEEKPEQENHPENVGEEEEDDKEPEGKEEGDEKVEEEAEDGENPEQVKEDEKNVEEEKEGEEKPAQEKDDEDPERKEFDAEKLEEKEDVEKPEEEQENEGNTDEEKEKEGAGDENVVSEFEDWHQTLTEASHCQRNFGTCTKPPCAKVSKLLSHCESCSLHSFGGCPECTRYCTLLLYHAQRCQQLKCTHHCMLIKDHIQDHGVPQDWSLMLDRLLFPPAASDCTLSEYAAELVDWVYSGMATRGPMPGSSAVRNEPKVLERPNKPLIPWTVSRGKLSVSANGHYDQDREWLEQAYLGGGSCGRCFQCQDMKTFFCFAIKKIPRSKFEHQELDIWQLLSGHHPNIVELYGAVQTKEHVIIFMEFMEGGSVDGLVEEQCLTEPHAFDIVYQVLSAVDFMHKNKAVHCDIKGANALLDAEGNAKLADFGAAVLLTDETSQPKCLRGTQAYMSPEACRCEPPSFSRDVWSIMCLAYKLLAGHPPWKEYAHCGTLLYIIGSAEEPPGPPPECCPVAADFFRRGFVLDPRGRETVRELLHHQVFVPGPAQLAGSCIHSSGTQSPPPEEQLSSLQSELFLASLQIEEGSTFFLANSLPTEADSGAVVQPCLPTVLLSVPSAQYEATYSDAPASTAAGPSDAAAYSITELTKVHIVEPDGELLFSLRHEPCTTYGALATQIYEWVARHTGLHCFTLTRPDGHQLQLDAAIGSAEQRLKVEPAYDVDSWGWRVGDRGLVERRSCA